MVELDLVFNSSGAMQLPKPPIRSARPLPATFSDFALDEMRKVDEEKIISTTENPKIDEVGNQRFFKDELLHREDGPAVIFVSGSKEWYFEGERHRDGGPAVENGNACTWYHHGQKHRIDGPAEITAHGDAYWYVNGKLHRLDGPAIDRKDGTYSWFAYGKLHREDGPASSIISGHSRTRIERWYYQGHPMRPTDLLKKVEQLIQQFNPLDANAHTRKIPNWIHARRMKHQDENQMKHQDENQMKHQDENQMKHQDENQMKHQDENQMKHQNENQMKATRQDAVQEKLKIARQVQGFSIPVLPSKKAVLGYSKDAFGNERYYDEQSRFHREDGPAITRSGGVQEWYFEGKKHRKDGPAYINAAHHLQTWYWMGTVVSEERHKRLMLGLDKLTSEETCRSDLYYHSGDRRSADLLAVKEPAMTTNTPTATFSTTHPNEKEKEEKVKEEKDNKTKIKQWPEELDVMLPYEDLYKPLKQILEDGYAPIKRNQTRVFVYAGYDLGKPEKQTFPPMRLHFSEKFLDHEKTKNARTLMDVVMRVMYLQGMENGRRAAYQEQAPIKTLHKTLDSYREKNKKLRYNLAKATAILTIKEECPNLSGQELNNRIQEELEKTRKVRLEEIRKDLKEDPSRCVFKPRQKKKHKLSDLLSIASSLDPEIVKREDWMDLLKEANITWKEWMSFAKKKHFISFTT
jgi:hypothetical protein